MEKIEKLLRSGNKEDIKLAFEFMMEYKDIPDIRKVINELEDFLGGSASGFFFKIGHREYVLYYGNSIWISTMKLEEKGYEFVGEYLGPHKELR